MGQAASNAGGAMARVDADVVDDAPDALTVTTSGVGIVEQRVGAQIERMVGFAQRAPRDVTSFMRAAITSATYNEEVAGSCLYAVPRSGQTIKGPSIRLAEIVATSWRNLWSETTISHEDERWITARAVVWDVERNTCISVDVRRRITDRKGKRYNDDGIQTTANAAMAIAFRNAVFKVVPAALWRQVYDAAIRVAVGDEKTIGEKRLQCLAHFAKLGVTNDRVFAAVGAKSDADLDAEALATLKGYANAIKEGEASIEACFPLPDAKPDPKPALPPGDAPLADKVRARREAEGAAASKEPDADPDPAAASKPIKPDPRRKSTGDADAEPPPGSLDADKPETPAPDPAAKPETPKGKAGKQASLIDPS